MGKYDKYTDKELTKIALDALSFMRNSDNYNPRDAFGKICEEEISKSKYANKDMVKCTKYMDVMHECSIRFINRNREGHI